MKLCVLVLVAAFCCGTSAKTEDDLEVLARQLIMQQLAQEEQVRNNGCSGLKKQRLLVQGSRPYHVVYSMCAIHDHANFVDTIGFGEFVGVLNGVEFRTRHNDYKLAQPSLTSKKYKRVQRIKYPDVPPEVTSKNTVAKQVEEMRLWFKAFADQDHSVRDYRKYFRPVMCYLEGAWTTARTLEESFKSDRHHLDAKSWFDLLEKVRYSAAKGAKSRLENFAYLPTKILNMINGTVPQMAQWNYRILCHPLKDDLPLNRLRVVDDVAHRMGHGDTLEDHAKTRRARFSVNQRDDSYFKDMFQHRGYLDYLMEQIPGMDNYPADLHDDIEGESVLHYKYSERKRKLNVGYYSRWYRTPKNDAMGERTRVRGFDDPTVFMARTTQPKISAVRYHSCKKNHGCETLDQTWTYAVPMEIIYMTPLQSWNPYKVEYKGEDKTKTYDENRKIRNTVTADGRYGSTTTTSKAYNGSRYNVYYRTPAEFFIGGEMTSTTADTSRTIKGVLDNKGKLRKVAASGFRIFLPYIKGAGMIRTRYPIMPLYHEGSSEYREIAALTDIVLKPRHYNAMFHENWRDPELKSITLYTGKPQPNDHTHKIVITPWQHSMIHDGRVIRVTTSEAKGHTHDLWINKSGKKFYMRKCDGARHCFDKHDSYLLTSKPKLSKNSL